MKRFISIIALTALVAVNAFAQTREQIEALIDQMPKIPNTREVRIGKLDNGLTYYIRKNTLPEQRAEFYLATNVGAAQEEYPSQDGLAHFLEHMCFNGTENFPDKNILNYLRSIGAEFGRNINASTGFEETQYMLNNIPVTRESIVDSCLMILRDYSHYVLNAPEEIDKERGVIIEERRSRRNAQWRNMERALPYYFGEDSPLASVTLIGQQEHLETFLPESIVSFYHTWYNPCNQAVVVVGDIDPDIIEAKIKEFFGPIPAKEDQKPKGIRTIADHAEPRVGIITDPETTVPSVEVIWHSENAPESFNATEYGQAAILLENIIGNVMSERFEDITSKPTSSFLGANFGFGDLIYEDIKAQYGEVSLKEENILGGFKDYYTELVRLQKYGITDAEFNRAKTELISRYEARVQKAETRRNSEFIWPILRNFFDKEPLLEPQEELDLVQKLLGQLNAQAISQYTQHLLGKENLVVIYSGPEKEGIATPTAEQLIAAMAEVEASDIAAPGGEEIPDSFLDPSKLKGSKISASKTGIYESIEWTLKNGVKVVVYPTDLTKDQILFDLYKDGGLSLISTDDMASFDRSIISLFQNNSGVSSFSGTVLSKMLTGKNLRVSPYFDSFAHGINGNSTVKDLETAFQLIYLMFTDPRFDPEEWENGIEQLRSYLSNLINQPNYKFNRKLTEIIYGDNPRKAVLSPEKLEKASLKVVEKNYRRLFKDAAGASLVVVGDVNPEALKPLVEKYIGSLPKGKKALSWVDNNDDLVSGRNICEYPVDMQTPKSTVFQIYNAPVAFSYEKDAAMDAISYILDMRYTESLREEEGGTYGASTGASLHRKATEKAVIQVYFDCKPALCDKLRQLAIDGLEDLAENGPTEAELNMAKLNLKKNLPEKRQSNSYWRGCIESYLEYGVDPDAATEAAIDALSPELVKATLREILASNNFIELAMTPAETAEAE